MTCRDVRELADSLVDERLGPETTRELRRHLATCSSCRAEVDGRRTLRRSLQTAFARARDLQPAPDFAARLRTDLSRTHPSKNQRAEHRRWFAVAAGVAIAVSLGVWGFGHGTTAPLDALALDAVGDHWNCGLKNRAIRTPVPLEEAAQRFDQAYRLLLTLPADTVSTPGGVVRVLDRHSCAFGTRRFGHVILEYHGRVVSLLLTGQDGDVADGSVARDAAPYVHGRSTNGFTVVSEHEGAHAILLVSDLETQDLVQLSQAISKPLARRLADSGVVPIQGREARVVRKECDGA